MRILRGESIVKGLLDSRNVNVKPEQEPTKKSDDIVLPYPEQYDPLLLDILKYVTAVEPLFCDCIA